MTPMPQAKQNDAMMDSVRKKRLGQYFTGLRLARVLAVLADAKSAQSVIDPMGGDGDMLAACIESGGGSRICVSVEIDPLAHYSAKERFAKMAPPSPTFILGNSFDHNVIEKLPQRTFDLVITNLPYVRYQSLSKVHEGDFRLPSAVEIRSNLLGLVNTFPHLDEKDRELLSTLISRYSGLSDLAVPSWFLCAMMTRVGGKLAMVVPEAWLTRDYAQIIQYLLLRWFRILVVVEDAHAVWFPDALVKTTLLVAERIDRRSSAFDWGDEGYLHARIDGQAMNRRSIVGNLFPNDSNPEAVLAEQFRELTLNKKNHSEALLTADWISLSQKAENLRRGPAAERWLHAVEDMTPSPPTIQVDDQPNHAVLPAALGHWLEQSSGVRLIGLSQLGVGVSQGLRTGANQFFYTDVLGKDSRGLIIEPNPIFGIKRVHLPASCALPVLRRQSELGREFRLDTSMLKGRVLALHDFALTENLEVETKTSANVHKIYKRMPQQLAELVRAAARTNVGTELETKWIPQLSAVRTNARSTHPNDLNSIPRFWYMLPPFTSRHRPELFVARVNSGHPRTILNAPERALIDANFSTLWVENQGKVDSLALLALLNSSWCIAAMELTASVMGGGALKLEATHIRRLPIPELDAVQIRRLSYLGGRLVSTHDAEATMHDIDTLMIDALVGSTQLAAKRSQLSDIKNTQLKMRTKRK